MGKTTRKGTEIVDFWPDDTETEFWIETGYYVEQLDLAGLLAKAKERWPDAKPEDVRITAHWIHTQCLYYDRYDPSDYTNFLRLEWIKPKDENLKG